MNFQNSACKSSFASKVISGLLNFCTTKAKVAIEVFHEPAQIVVRFGLVDGIMTYFYLTI